MKRWITRVAAVATLTLVTQAPASAQTLFYNGQWNQVDGQTSATNTGNENQVIFENFVVGGLGWNVTGLFGEFITNTSWTTANWEIRSGISAANAGTLVASGIGPTVTAATGRSGFGYTEYRTTVTGLSVLLNPGTYWLGFAPVGISNVAGKDIYLSYTSGVNGVNSVLDGDFFVRNVNSNYQEPSSFGNPNFAVGVLGTPVTQQPPPSNTVPEPATFALMVVGCTVVAAAARRRRSA